MQFSGHVYVARLMSVLTALSFSSWNHKIRRLLGTLLRLVAEGAHASQTPFGSILEHQDLHDGDGQLFNQCSFWRVEPIWQSASDAVVQASGDSLIRFLVNRPLVRGSSTLQKTIFYQSELSALSRYPPCERLQSAE